MKTAITYDEFYPFYEVEEFSPETLAEIGEREMAMKACGDDMEAMAEVAIRFDHVPHYNLVADIPVDIIEDYKEARKEFLRAHVELCKAIRRAKG